MTTTRPLIVDVFAAAGLTAHESGVLPLALNELAVRLDLAGAGELLSLLTDACWVPHETVCSRCGHKGTPKPHPRPQPKPPANPEPKGCDGQGLSAQCVANRRDQS